MSEEKDLILDIGANNGEDSYFYALQGYSVVAVEANPSLCDDISAQTKMFDLPIDVRNVAVSPNVGEIDFYINKHVSTWSSVDEGLGSRVAGAEKTTVRSAPLKEVVGADAERVAYAKIDIEGMDAEALRQLVDADIRPKYVSLENGTTGQLEILISAGYDKFKYVNQSTVHFQQVPFRTKHSDYFEHRFVRGASGLWGEDAPGVWMDVDTARDTAQSLLTARHDWKGQSFAEFVGWFDLYASRSSDPVPKRTRRQPVLRALGEDPRFQQDVRGFVYVDGALLRNLDFTPLCLTQYPGLVFRSVGFDGALPVIEWDNTRDGVKQRWIYSSRFVHAKTETLKG